MSCLSSFQLLLLSLAATSVNAPRQLLAVALLSQVPVVVGGAALARSLSPIRPGRRDDRPELQRLISRVALAEARLAREQDRLHELRATVASVALSHRLLSDELTPLPRPTRRRLERLRESELGRLERLLGDTPTEPLAPVDLGQVLDPVVDGIRLRGHSVTWVGTHCRALGRPDDIAEIAQILLDNAVRHAGGKQVVLAVSQSADGVELRVGDAGPGVPPTHAAAVFERGVRTAGSSGEGIGLHIARRLSRGLGGDLRLESDTSTAGADFVLRLLDPTGVAPCLVAAV